MQKLILKLATLINLKLLTLVDDVQTVMIMSVETFTTLIKL